MSCKICGNDTFETAYEGKVRMGKFGDWSRENYTLQRCLKCRSIAMPNLMGELGDYYESGNYRQDVDGGDTLDHFFRLHDPEQLRNLGMTGTDGLRGKLIADIGCGAGAYLDFASGAAARCIAVEPNKVFRDGLIERGYHTFDYAYNAAKEFGGQVDLATCFSTVEHIEDPLNFCKDIRKLLKPEGRLIMSTPNANDVLLHSLPEEYGRFFYRKVHLWYWDAEGFANLLKEAGFSETRVIPHHRFGLSNYLNWLKEKRPRGDARLPWVTPTMDAVWRSELERNQTCDYLVIEAKP